MLTRLLLSATAVVIGTQLIRAIYRHLSSPLRHVPGPPNPSLLFGYFGKTTFAKTQEWQAQFGPTFKFHLMLNNPTLYTIDTVALHHILNSDIYQKAPRVRHHMRERLGRGLLVLEDEEHTKLRKIMSPAFGLSQIRGLTQLFVDKAIELSNVWGAETPDESGWAQIEVVSGLKNMTLDVIGLAGFNYEFNALRESANPTALANAFRALFTHNKHQAVAVLRGQFPVLRALIPTSKTIFAARRTMDNIGIQLLQDAKSDISSREKDAGRKDILSLLVKSNMSADLTESQRLSDEEVISQLPTFFVAGHETTSTATAWALYALACHPRVQDTLRSELSAMGTDTPSLDALNGLVYLDKFVREVMRLYAPVVFTNRMAVKDDVIPLGTPYTDTKGIQHDSLAVQKGQTFWIPVAAVNRDPRLWGPDADEFNPDRWDSVPSPTSGIPGIYAHLLTFLAGPHNCIGWRFSLAEMKALLYTLVRGFEYELAVKAEDICASMTPVQRPMVSGKEDEGVQLPMRVRRVQG
ncbi:cytochrome P450 [Mycena galericulata]|nr:cytochrome P450 [Mycena galericulata]